MPEWIEDLAGDEWEEYAGSLIRCRHDPADVQAVPAINGDLGVDFWIRGSGVVYQCYGTELGVTYSERLRLQKKKLRDEVLKLKKNGDRIARMIAPAICRRYVFFVPRHDSKELLEYAAGKSREIREVKPAFCSEDFEIAVQSLVDFETERSVLKASSGLSPRLVETELAAEEVHQWLTDHGELVSTIRKKLEAVRRDSSSEQVETHLQQTVENYLAVEDALQKLEADYPELYENTRRVLSNRRRRLRALGGSASRIGLEALAAEFDCLVQELAAPEVGIERSDAGVVAAGTMASWLADCTLDPR